MKVLPNEGFIFLCHADEVAAQDKTKTFSNYKYKCIPSNTHYQDETDVL